MNDKESLLFDLKQTVLDMLTDLSQVFTQDNEKDDLAIIMIFYKKLDLQRIMKYTIEKLLPHKEQIKNRDINFFDKNRYIFAGLPDKRVAHYRDAIFVDKRISIHDMNIIWDYFEAIITITDLYEGTI